MKDKSPENTSSNPNPTLKADGLTSLLGEFSVFVMVSLRSALSSARRLALR
jgi:hypothetical protein